MVVSSGPLAGGVAKPVCSAPLVSACGNTETSDERTLRAAGFRKGPLVPLADVGVVTVDDSLERPASLFFLDCTTTDVPLGEQGDIRFLARPDTESSPAVEHDRDDILTIKVVLTIEPSVAMTQEKAG